ncbi:PGDYG domain-containing protein [Chitinasiproducens palmae]|uniref:PGDYG protein n=1 Tax=Chitinasiproducens palmae TaxID=1770053 RepID=A0A1H2PPL3_9BURK|nr:PGDYG domain-containing protein [Chitinasiproducens palmae]SDV48663.1 PGDYG protein [Chitinasiproducens palmae]
MHFEDIDLRADPAARPYVKDEVVEVSFATGDGALDSLEGANRYAPGDALLRSASGECWVVSRDRFDAKYFPADSETVEGAPGRYRNRPSQILAKRIDVAFSVRRSAGSDVLEGVPGDWLVQYAPGDYGLVQQARFARVYRLA